MSAPTPSLWSRLRTVGLPFFKSASRWRSLGGLGLLITLLIFVNGMNVVNSYVGRDFMTALAERHVGWFFVLAGALAGVFAVSTVLEVLARYAEQWLGMVWRQWLTRLFMDRYLAGRAYLRLSDQHELDNPDERISLDIKSFTATSLSILVMLLNGLLTLVAFSWVLWQITPWLFVTALGYAVFGSVGTILLGRRLVTLNNEQIQKEADFRYGLGRVREHAEAVAQVGGEEEQKGRLLPLLTRVIDNFRAVIRLGRRLGFFITAVKYMPQIIPVVIVAPLYMRHDVEFGAVTQAAMAFAQVQGAFALFETQYQELTSYAAIVGRLGMLWEATEPPAREAPLEPLPQARSRQRRPQPLLSPSRGAGAAAGPEVDISPEARRVVFDHLTLWTPHERRPLIRDLSLETTEGKRVAITGANGAGEALLLATAGLWQDGQGRISRPEPTEVMFVPQRPFAASGRLRDTLRSGLAREIPDHDLEMILKDVGLEEAIARAGGLDAEQAWAQVLSTGELQALTFARLLLANPRFAFLDEPAKVTEPPLAERLYQALARSSITYVSAGCPDSLLSYHDLRLKLHQDGSWEVEPLTRNSHHG